MLAICSLLMKAVPLSYPPIALYMQLNYQESVPVWPIGSSLALSFYVSTYIYFAMAKLSSLSVRELTFITKVE